ncbi:MAG: DoxX family protein [bacterium]
MSDTTKKWLLIGIKAFLTLAFVAAGLAKLAGVQMMVDEFAVVGLGQWFRYVTGLIEIGSAVLLWVPGLAAYGAGLQVCVVLGALVAHLTVLGMATSGGVFVLGPLAAVTLWFNRGQLTR